MPSIIDFVYAILILCGLGICIANFIIIIVAVVEGVTVVDKFLNPKTLYEKHKVNKFGCVMLTLFYHIVFCVHAIWFWFYKLCTVGRK